MAPAPRIDLSDPAFFDDPHPVLDALRASDPVQHDGELDRVVLTRAADVAAVLADRGLSVDPYKARPTAYGRRGRTEAGRGDVALAFRDDPDHARLRGLVAKAFTARAVEDLRPRIEAIAAELLDAIDPGEPFDLVPAYAAPLPILVIAALLGIDAGEVAQFRQWSLDAVLQPSPLNLEADRRRQGEAVSSVLACIAATVGRRRASPRDDLISALVAAEADGDRLSEREILNTCGLLLVAGNVTTTDLIGNGVVALLRHPGQLARLRAEPDLWPAAIEEVLRYDAPVAAWNRQSLDDREVGGCPVEAGQTITTMLLAANHDPALHADPHAFDIGRPDQRHHSFGGGAHFCWAPRWRGWRRGSRCRRFSHASRPCGWPVEVNRGARRIRCSMATKPSGSKRLEPHRTYDREQKNGCAQKRTKQRQ